MSQSSSQAAQASALAVADDIIDNNELYFVSKYNCYFLKTTEGWTRFVKDALPDVFPVCSDKNVREALRFQMRQRGRVCYEITYTVKSIPGKLNLLDMSKWLTPTPGAYHWLFDMLLISLSSGDTDKLEHIERLIAYKYTTPFCPSLPALLVHGEGTVGKNLLVEYVLATLFAGAVASGPVETLMGTFNEPLIGKVVGLIDEVTAKKVNHDNLKNTLGSSVFWAHEKGLSRYECPAICWYIISSNKHEGGIYLDRSGADRRYSIFHVEAKKDLYYWLTPKLNEVTGETHTVEQATIWLKRNFDAILTDKQDVSHWIHALIEKHKGKPIPLAYHGADFARMMDIQKPVEECIIPDVFNEPDFTHINRQTLYDGYKVLAKSDERHTIISSRYFFAKMRAWLKANKEGVIPDTEKQYRQRQYDHTNKCWVESPKAWCWASVKAINEDKPHTTNDHEYIDTSDSFRPKWRGPQEI